MMMNDANLSILSKQQLWELLWEKKGTPDAQPLYAELSRRQSTTTLKPDDPDWEAKMTERLLHGQTVQPPT
jgi:hypothetical protein